MWNSNNMNNKLGLFDFINIINEKKVIPDSLEGYDSFMMNRAFSNSMDTVFIANEINNDCDIDMNFDYYYNAVPKKRRYAKWPKKAKESSDKKSMLNNIIERFNCSLSKAQDIYVILDSKNLLDEYTDANYKGGKFR